MVGGRREGEEEKEVRGRLPVPLKRIPLTGVEEVFLEEDSGRISGADTPVPHPCPMCKGTWYFHSTPKAEPHPADWKKMQPRQAPRDPWVLRAREMEVSPRHGPRAMHPAPPSPAWLVEPWRPGNPPRTPGAIPGFAAIAQDMEAAAALRRAGAPGLQGSSEGQEAQNAHRHPHGSWLLCRPGRGLSLTALSCWPSKPSSCPPAHRLPPPTEAIG